MPIEGQKELLYEVGKGGSSVSSVRSAACSPTFSESAKNTFTVLSRRDTASNLWSGLYLTPRTSSDIFIVLT